MISEDSYDRIDIAFFSFFFFFVYISNMIYDTQSEVQEQFSF